MFENATNITSFGGLLEYNNTATEGIFGLFMLIGIMLIGYVSTGQYRKEVSFSFATFIGLISSVFFSAMGLVGGHIVVICAVMCAGSVLYLLTRS